MAKPGMRAIGVGVLAWFALGVLLAIISVFGGIYWSPAVTGGLLPLAAIGIGIWDYRKHKTLADD